MVQVITCVHKEWSAVSDSLPRSRPEEQGIRTSGILSFLEALEESKLELHSFMLLRHGHVVAEGWWSPYERGRPHMLFSLSKSFTSTAVGLAVAEGRLSVDDRVAPFFPDDVPALVDANMAALRVRHLLSMSTGHDEDTSARLRQQKDGNWVRGFLETEVKYPPGSHFLYNNGASYMLSAIVQSVTGQTLLDYLQPRLFEPLGVEGATWDTCPRGVNTGGWGLSVRTEDIAKFGQLYLQKGMFQGKRVLPEAWVEEATARHVANGDDMNSDWAYGYGYQFWRCRYGAYRGDGAFGQFCVVMPEQDAVLAITSGLNDMQGVLNLVWQFLLPAMSGEPLPSAETSAAFEEKLAALALVPPQMRSYSPAASSVSGKRYEMDDNEDRVKAVLLTFEKDGCAFTMWDDRGEHRIPCGYGEWIKGETIGPQGNLTPVMASGTWADDRTFVLTSRLMETPFCQTLTFRFEGDELRLELSVNVSFGPKDHSPVLGRLAK